jgi:NAD(P)-dependent dehydrogenase (short-subunit alcohol dehydrogenase family)
MPIGNFLMRRQMGCHHISVIPEDSLASDTDAASSADLTGRAVLVTGGTKGLGRGLADAFRAAGAHVVVCARSAPDGDAAGFVTADVRDPDQAAAAVDAVVARHGRVDVVVNNAGGSPPADAATVSPRFVEKIVALNLLGPFYVAQRANAVMQQQDDGGVIINIGSLSGTRPSPGTAAYGAAKAGLLNLTRTLAMEWAPRVRVNSITVGYLETEQAALFYGDDASVAAIASTIPMQRMVQPADVAAACLFLASPGAAFLTGSDIRVDGGGERPTFLGVRER